MTHDEAKAIIAEMQETWPDWEPTKDELWRWETMFQRFAPATIRQAVQVHWEATGWKAPRSGGVLKALGEMKPQRPRAGPSDEVDDMAGQRPGVYRQCIESPQGTRRLGWFVRCSEPVFDDADAVRKAVEDAESMKQQHEQLYGGQWQIVQQATPREMAERRGQLRSGLSPEHWAEVVRSVTGLGWAGVAQLRRMLAREQQNAKTPA